MTDASTPPERPVQTMLPFVLAITLALIAGYGLLKWRQVEQARVARQQAIPSNSVGPPLTDFELTERSGEIFRSTDMRGRVWVATYFFTSCPGSCIRLNQNIQFLNSLPELADVTWVSITCDPDTDTLERLREYADRYEADPQRWLFCRSDLETVMRVGRGMLVDVYRQGHKDFAVVFDKTGAIRGMFDATSKSQSQQLRTMLLTLLDEDPTANVAEAAETSPPDERGPAT